MSFLLLPEILDEILEHVYYSTNESDPFDEYNYKDIYACLFVNQRFYAHALPLLYRNIHFASSHFSDRFRDSEDKLWKQLRRTKLARYIRTMEIALMSNIEGPQSRNASLFIKRIVYILGQACNLNSVYIYNYNKCDHIALDSILSMLEKSKSHPELSFYLEDINNPSSPTESVVSGELVWNIRDKLKVTSISVTTHGSPMKMQFLAGFRQLRKLCFRDMGFMASTTIFDETSDLNQVFNNVPLEILNISVDIIKKLPRTIKILDISGWNRDIALKSITWAAICDLPEVNDLCMRFSEVHAWEDGPSHFQSANLRSLRVTLGAGAASILQQQIFQPIFDTCHYISCLDVNLKPAPLSTPLLSSFFTSSVFLTSLMVTGYSNPYTLKDVVKCGKNLPHLKTLKLPLPSNLDDFPAVYEYATEDGGQVTIDYWYDRERNHDVPVRFNFQECQQLAMMCPKVNRVEFQIDTFKTPDNDYKNFSEFSLPSSNFPIYSTKVRHINIQSYQRRLQSFKMSRFIDELSPCLNVCTLLFNDRDQPLLTYTNDEAELVIFLSLEHIRKHNGHL